MACNIVRGWESSGSYTKVNSLLDLPSEPLTIQGTSDITITFDNEQKVGRHSGRIREGSKQLMSIITTVAIIKSNPETRCQFSEFNRQDVDITKTLIAVEKLEDYYRDVMRTYRYHFINEIIQSVLREQFVNDHDDIKDYVDVYIRNNRKYVPIMMPSKQ